MIGDFAHPMKLTQAASDGRIASGHHVYLLDGNHDLLNGATFNRSGASYAPYQGARPVLQMSKGNVVISGDDITFTGIEFAGVNTSRLSQQSGSSPTDIDFYRLLITGKRVTLAGCIIHDITELNVDHVAQSFALRDCIVYNCGWFSDGWHGHEFYGQNDGGGALVIENCIFAQSGAYGMHFYAVDGSLIGLHIRNLIQFNPKFAIGGETGAPIDDVSMTESVLWNINAVIGRSSLDCGSLTSTDNYYGLQVPSISAAWQSVANTGNVTGSGGENVVKVFPCVTPGKVAHIAVMNWEQRDTVMAQVDGLTIGVAYRLRDAYDPLVNMTAFTYEGGGVVLPFMGRTVAKPVGFDTAVAVLDKRFGAWILESI